jgi:hypothetical protein
MKMRILDWLYGNKEREKQEKKKQKKEKQEKSEKMPDFRRIFCSLPNVVKSKFLKPGDIETQHFPSFQDRADAKSAAEKELKAAVSKNKADDVCARIQTVRSKNLEVVWLLQTNEDIPYKSLKELIEGYRNVKDKDSYRGMSVNYASGGKLHEISPLHEQDLDGLAKILECQK